MSDAAQGEAQARPVASLSFEDALSELETIVRRLESGDVALERSIALYERGAELKAHCEQKLQAAQLKVEKIVLSPDGAASAAAAELD